MWFQGDTFNVVQHLALSGRPPYLGNTLADLNRSGNADLLGYSGDSLYIWQGTGDPNYPSSPIVLNMPLLGPFMVADLNGDGLPELVGTQGIAWNNGDYQFTFVTITTNGVLAVGDLNNDGKPDLIAVTGIFLNRGGGNFTQVANDGVGAALSGHQVALGDFNGDGKLDVAHVEPWAEPFVTVAYGRGDGTFYVQSILAAENGVGAGNVAGGIVVGDFNGDGMDDIVTPIELSTHLVLYTNAGNGQFASSLFASGAVAAKIMKTDFNMDDKADVAILNWSPVIVFGR